MNTWSYVILNQTAGLLRSVVSTQTSHVSPGSQEEDFNITYYRILLTGGDKDWTWDILCAKEMLYPWAMVPAFRIKQMCIVGVIELFVPICTNPGTKGRGTRLYVGSNAYMQNP